MIEEKVLFQSPANEATVLEKRENGTLRLDTSRQLVRQGQKRNQVFIHARFIFTRKSAEKRVGGGRRGRASCPKVCRK